MYRCLCQSWSLAAIRSNMPRTPAFTAWVAQELIASTGNLKACWTAMPASLRLMMVSTYHLAIIKAPSSTTRAVSLTAQAASYANLAKLRWSAGGCTRGQTSLPIYRTAVMFKNILQTSIWRRRDLRMSKKNLGKVGGLFDSWEQSNLSSDFSRSAGIS